MKPAVFGFLVFFLSACGTGEPEIIRTIASLPTIEKEETSSLPSPSAAVGEELFRKNCVACHGDEGEGDGPLALSGEIPHPGNFRLGYSAAAQSPQEWFTTITEGRLERLMPPWQSLSMTERWELTWYSYTLSYSIPDLTQGREIWAAHCTACHSPISADSEDSAFKGNFFVPAAHGDMEEWRQYGDAQLAELIRLEHAELLAKGGVTQDELRAVVRYLRAESLGGSEEYWREIAALPPAQSPLRDIPIDLPEDQISDHPMEIWLRAHAGDAIHEQWLAKEESTGGYWLRDIPIVPEWRYQAVAESDSSSFRSIFYDAQSLQSLSQLPLQAITMESGALRQDSLALQFQPLTASDGDFVLVTEALRLKNMTQLMYTEGAAKSWQLPLPPGANLLKIAANERQAYDAISNSIFALQPILPGADELVGLQYSLPWSELAVYEYPLPYGLSGPLRVLLPAGEFKILGVDWPRLGEEMLNEQQYTSYGIEADLEPGSVLRFGLARETNQLHQGSSNWGIVFTLLAIAVSILSLWLARKQR